MRITELLKWGFPLFFASPGVVVDGGAGGDGGDSGAGDGGAGGEGAGAGDEGDTGDDSAEEVADLTEGDEGGEESAEEDPTDDGADAGKKAAGRASPDAIKKALNKLRESDPESAALLRKTFFKQEQDLGNFRQEFRTPADARAAREVIENFGGEEGISKLNTEANEYAAELTAMSKGDPRVVEELARDFPEGLVKLTPIAADKLREVNPQAYERFAGRIIATTLKDKGVPGAVDRIMELIYDGKQNDAFAKAKALKEWMQGVEQFASTKSQNEPDPRDKEIREREQTLEQREHAAFRGRVASAVTQRMNSTIQKHIAPYLKDAVKAKRVLSTEQKQGLASGVYTRISNALSKDARYQDRLKALLSEGDVGKIERFVSGQVDQHVKKAVRSEWHSRGFAGGAAKKAATNGADGGNAGPSGISTKPEAAKIDWSWDKTRMKYTGDGEFGEAKLLPKFGGKVVKFRH